MAGAKKKKTKPAANPARGFATTSVASKPVARVDKTEGDVLAPAKGHSDTVDPSKPGDTITASTTQPDKEVLAVEDISPEEFERRLEESELQVLVEKHAEKVRRDAQRQKSRLETDRRLLRSQAEALNIRRWLPQELIDHILELIQAENRFSASAATAAETASTSKLPSEEELTMRLWTLQDTLTGAAFSEARVKAAVLHVLDIATSVSATTKDSIWGLEEALDWLARECTGDELRNYEWKGQNSRPSTGMSSYVVVLGQI